MNVTQARRRPADDEFVMPSLRIDGRVALVTGGSRGLGLGMALALAHAGADVALAARTRDELEVAAELVRGTGREALVVPTDVAEVTEVDAMVDAVGEHFGRIDVLINAAGVNIRKPSDEFTESDWDRLLAVNLKGRVLRVSGRGAMDAPRGRREDHQPRVALVRDRRAQHRPLRHQ